MWGIEILFLLLAYGGVIGVLLFYESKRLKLLISHDGNGAETDSQIRADFKGRGA